jgi:hypothetical protein
MNKQSIEYGLLSTVTLHGSSMQLYFLPYLFFVALGFLLISSVLGQLNMKHLPWLGGLTVLLTGFAMLFPTRSAFGPDMRLVPLYGAMYVLGNCFSTALHFSQKSYRIFSLVSLVVSGALAHFDSRFIAVSITLLLFMVAFEVSSMTGLQGRSFYGSGGVYLLHTPVLNFAISTMMLHFGIVSYINLFASVFITFGICLPFTIWFVSRFKSLRFLLLE